VGNKIEKLTGDIPDIESDISSFKVIDTEYFERCFSIVNGGNICRCDPYMACIIYDENGDAVDVIDTVKTLFM